MQKYRNTQKNAKNSKDIFPVKQRVKYQTQKMKSQTLRQNKKMKKDQRKKINFGREKQRQHPDLSK